MTEGSPEALRRLLDEKISFGLRAGVLSEDILGEQLAVIIEQASGAPDEALWHELRPRARDVMLAPSRESEPGPSGQRTTSSQRRRKASRTEAASGCRRTRRPFGTAGPSPKRWRPKTIPGGAAHASLATS